MATIGLTCRSSGDRKLRQCPHRRDEAGVLANSSAVAVGAAFDAPPKSTLAFAGNGRCMGSSANARRPACGSQLHTRPTCARSVSRTGRLLRSSTLSPNANPRENNKTAAGGPGRVLIVSARTIGETKNPVADAQTFSPTTCKLAALYILD